MLLSGLSEPWKHRIEVLPIDRSGTDHYHEAPGVGRDWRLMDEEAGMERCWGAV